MSEQKFWLFPTDSEGLRISDPPNILNRTKILARILMWTEIGFWGAQNFWSPCFSDVWGVSLKTERNRLFPPILRGSEFLIPPTFWKQKKIGYFKSDSEGLRISDPPKFWTEILAPPTLSDRFWGAQNFWSPQHFKQNKIGYFLRFWGAQNFWYPQHFKTERNRPLRIGENSTDSEGLRISDPPNILNRTKLAIFSDSGGSEFLMPLRIGLKPPNRFYFHRCLRGSEILIPPDILKLEIGYFHRFWGAQNFWSPRHRWKQNKIGF